MMSKRKGSRKGQDFTAQGINNVANAFKDVTTKKIPDAIGKMKKEREGSRKGSTVQQIIDAFDRDCVPHGELIRMAKELPDGLGDRVLIGLGAGSWRGDTPEEEEFFKIIDSKCSRNGSSVRKGTGPLCDLGSVSGKGSRPENLGSIASSVSLGRNRSINMDGEYVEQESREGSRKGKSSSDVEEKYGKIVADKLRLADRNYDLFLSDELIMSKYDVTQEQLDFYKSVMGYQ